MSLSRALSPEAAPTDIKRARAESPAPAPPVQVAQAVVVLRRPRRVDRDVETTKAVYDRIFELKIANAQVVINYANFLEENEYWEESFKVR